MTTVVFCKIRALTHTASVGLTSRCRHSVTSERLRSRFTALGHTVSRREPERSSRAEKKSRVDKFVAAANANSPHMAANWIRANAFECCADCRRPSVNVYNLRLIRRIAVITVAATAAGTGGLLGACMLPYLGFTGAGVAAGSWAASVQTPMTAAGSMFAVCQYLGATNVGTLAFGAAGSVGSTGTALYLLRKIANTIDFCTCEPL